MEDVNLPTFGVCSSLLEQPSVGQRLYKIMTVDNLIRSLEKGYLHFNRVDSYTDSPVADSHDSEQLRADRVGNSASRFEKAPDFSAADYYDRARSRTYACCFGVENADYLWVNYGNGCAHGKVGLEFDWDKFCAHLAAAWAGTRLGVHDGDLNFANFMAMEHGLVRYVEWHGDRANVERLPNPLTYAYLKDEKFRREGEMRITISAPGIFAGFRISSGPMLEFPTSLEMPFDFRASIASGCLKQIIFVPETDRTHLEAALGRLRIHAAGAGL